MKPLLLMLILSNSLAAAQSGKSLYAANVVLYGLADSIKVGTKTYNGAMPGFEQLSDADIAALLNEVATSWSNAFPDKQKPYTTAEVNAERATKKTPAQVYALRPKALK